jgi:hypothetical protein
MRDVQTMEEIQVRLLNVAFNSVLDEDFLGTFCWILVNEYASLRANIQAVNVNATFICMCERGYLNVKKV